MSHYYSHHGAPPPLHDDHGRLLKPSERFARPNHNGPVFIVDKQYGYHNHLSFIHDPYTASSSEQGSTPSPQSTVSHRHSGGATSASAATSIEEDNTYGKLSPPPIHSTYSYPYSIPSSNASKYNAYSPPAPPQLPSKNAERSTFSKSVSGDPNASKNGMRITIPHAEDQLHDQEARDQLSPLLSPRRLDYGQFTPTRNGTEEEVAAKVEIQFPPPEVRTGGETEETSKPPRRKSFFKLPKSGRGTAAAPAPAAACSTGNVRASQAENVPASSPTSFPVIANDKQNKASFFKHVRRSSADSTSTSERTNESMANMTTQENDTKRSSRSMTKGIVASLGRRSKSANRTTSTSSPPLPTRNSLEGNNATTWQKSPYENGKGKNYPRSNGMSSALDDNDWISVAPGSDAQLRSDGYQNARMSFNKPHQTSRMNEALPPTPLPPPIPSPERQKYDIDHGRRHDHHYHHQATDSSVSPKTPSPVKSRHYGIQNWRSSSSSSSKPSSAPSLYTPPASTSPSSEVQPSDIPNRDNMKSPPFFMRGKKNAQKDSGSKGISSSNRLTSPLGFNVRPHSRQSVQTHHTSPPSQVQEETTPTTRTIAAWPAESHVFGAAQQVIGKATIGPHVAEVQQQKKESVAAPIVPIKPSIVTPKYADNTFNNGRKSAATNDRSGTPSFASANDVFTDAAVELVQDPRKRVMDILNIPLSRKSSLYTSFSSINTSGSSTPLPASAAAAAPPSLTLAYCRGKPRLEEAILGYPNTILACLLDHLSYRSFKKLVQSSPRIYRAAYQDEYEKEQDTNVLLEVVRQRYLASYGYRPIPLDLSVKYPQIIFKMKDLNAFQIGMEYSLAEYFLFASEHKRLSLEKSITRMLRDSTRSFNKLVFRLQIQYQYSSSSSSASPSISSTSSSQSFKDKEDKPKLIKPHWQYYKRQDQFQVFKIGRCALLRVWVPCASDQQWMTDQEVVEVEREVHRSGVWNLLRKGDLVRNIALGDIANEGLLIFDGKYLRDLSYTHDTIGHLPAWMNALTFSPSYFHNQIASSTAQPIVYLNLTSFQTAVQSNLLLCKEKVDMASPSGEQYKITRYVYRTVIDLVPGTVLDESESKSGAGSETLHPDWAGQLVIETDGTTEAAKALLSRVSPISREIISNQPRPPQHINNRPYRILRNLSRPGLIFCRVVDDVQPNQLFGR